MLMNGADFNTQLWGCNIQVREIEYLWAVLIQPPLNFRLVEVSAAHTYLYAEYLRVVNKEEN